MFNIFHGHAPEYLCEHFNLNNNLTRGATNLIFLVPSGNTYNKISFVCNTILDWNNFQSLSKIFLINLHSNQQLKDI